MYLCWPCSNQGVWRVRTAQRGERNPSGVLNTDWLWLPRTVEMCEAHVWRCSSGTRWSTTTGTQKNSATGSGSSFTILLCYHRKYLPFACSLSICFSFRGLEPPWDKVTYVEFLTHCSSGEESPLLSLPLAMRPGRYWFSPTSRWSTWHNILLCICCTVSQDKLLHTSGPRFFSWIWEGK